jgi:hypothetical protein
MATQFEQLATHTQELNRQVFTLSTLYRDVLRKPSSLAGIATAMKSIFSAFTKLFTKKKP